MGIFPKISLGTAQFGKDYGVTNKIGKVKEKDIKNIIKRSQELGIRYLDTAPSYGNAEALLGKAILKNYKFKLVSKLAKQSSEKFDSFDLKKWDQAFEDSLKNLSVDSIDTLLLHSSDDLKKQNSNLLQKWLLELKRRKKVRNIGISIYSKKDLDNLSLNDIDVVQLPFSLYNQTLLLDGTIEKLKSNNCLIQVRSIYLQGLLINSHMNWPNWVGEKYLKQHKDLEKIALKNNLSLLDISLDFIKKQNFIDLIVIGICSISELEELKTSIEKRINIQDYNYKDFHINDSKFTDPRFWPK